jgi:hypothetical protein
MRSNVTVIYDACVLFPAPLRDFLMRLALTDLYRARWTAFKKNLRSRLPPPSIPKKSSQDN